MIFNVDIHSKLFIKLAQLSISNYKIFDYVLEINSLTGEVIWSKKGVIDIYANPYLLGDNISFMIVNHKIKEMESVSLKNETKLYDNGILSIDDILNTYINIVTKKIIEWKVK